MLARLISNQGLLRISHSKQALTLFSTYQKTPQLKTWESGLYPDTGKDLIRAIQESPWELYKQMVKRIEDWGALAPMPEFRPAVNHLQNKLESDALKNMIRQNEGILEPFRIKALQDLFHISVDFSATEDPAYPHCQPFADRYPYLPTIHAIVNALSFLDIINRMEYEGISAPYHTDRYRYHLTHMYDLPSEKNGKFVYLPLVGSLYLRDFLKLRPVPLGFLGVSTQMIFNDAYWNGAEDFFYHDVNHVRRLNSYNQRAWTNQNPLEIIAKNYDFINQMILPALEVRLADSNHEQDIKKLSLVLFFELFHEYAYALDLEQLKAAYEFKSGDPSPFEHIVDKSFKPEELEKIRMPNSNLESGFTFFKHNPKDPTVRYFMDRGPNFIASCLNKLNNYFYDSPWRPSWSLPKKENRTAENIAEAALLVADLIFQNKHIYTKEGLLEMAKDTKALEIYPGNASKRPKIRDVANFIEDKTKAYSP